MNQLSKRYLKTGGDPRTLPDYASLRDELSKLAHPARPDVNWVFVHKRCLALFEHNGVELQTAAWYTQTRAQLAGLSGLNEGLAILEALISYQWETLWPQSVHARVEILSSLSRRLQKMLRTLPLSYSDLNLDQLYLAEEQLMRLNKGLQRREVQHLCQFDTLTSLVQTIMTRLENSDETETNSVEFMESSDRLAAKIAVPEPPARVPDKVTPPPEIAPEEAPAQVRWIYVAQPDEEEGVAAVIPGKPMFWKPFAAGMCVMLVVAGAALWGWNIFFPPNPLLVQLESSVAPLPVPLSGSQIHSLPPDHRVPEDFVEQTRQQLAWIATYSPDWSLAYGEQLVKQLQLLRPEDDAAKKLAQTWQQQLDATALPVDALRGWHQGMTELQQLTAKLNALDGKRGKYMTVSELKSVVYSATQAFNRSVPVEEQLRLYASSPSDVQRRQAEMALQQLQKRYFLLRQDKGSESP
ncbi:VasL domain-containing protein [Erwinia sorbitola]|uniref:Type VI secretion system ImpA family N-terminal domain-containing protein n=1 Tax=Erwinia sorbitola TaxID=2681984 RepID=A0ABW9RH33_9GAMM|nr:VasL domain-containing protein [Erwinia sorbitola]MTD29402.1 hypothetical protein [Erwinia sorbitola]